MPLDHQRNNTSRRHLPGALDRLDKQGGVAAVLGGGDGHGQLLGRRVALGALTLEPREPLVLLDLRLEIW